MSRELLSTEDLTMIKRAINSFLEHLPNTGEKFEWWCTHREVAQTVLVENFIRWLETDNAEVEWRV